MFTFLAMLFDTQIPIDHVLVLSAAWIAAGLAREFPGISIEALGRSELPPATDN